MLEEDLYRRKRELLQDMFSYLRRPTPKKYEQANNMLHMISDLSSGEDSPIGQADEEPAPNVVLQAVQAVLAMQLSGDNGSMIVDAKDTMSNFSTLFLMLWALQSTHGGGCAVPCLTSLLHQRLSESCLRQLGARLRYKNKKKEKQQQVLRARMNQGPSRGHSSREGTGMQEKEKYQTQMSGLMFITTPGMPLVQVLRKPSRLRLLDEVDIAESADAWLRTRKSEVADEERDELVTLLMASMDSFAANDINYVHVDPLEVDEDTEMVDDAPNEEDKGENKTHRDSGFIVVTTAKNCKRLHKASGGCWMAREKILNMQRNSRNDRQKQSTHTHTRL
eukprot:s1612_g11.t1